MESVTIENKKCYLCNSTDIKIRDGSVRNNDQIRVLECKNCGLVFLSSFSHIDENFYENSGMFEGTTDLDSWRTETKTDDKRRADYLKETIYGKKVIDIGCGNGGFLLYANEYTESLAGVEPDEVPRDDLQKKGFKIYQSIDEVKDKFDIVTCFHVIEHVKDPILFLSSLKKLINRDGLIIIETPNSEDALLTLYKSPAFENFTYWDCHLILFNIKTIQQTAEKSGLKTSFLSQIQRHPVSNHLYWLAEGKPGGQLKWNFLNTPILSEEYERVLSSIGACDTIIAGFKQGDKQ